MVDISTTTVPRIFSSAMSSFPCFPSLPPELRRLVWQDAMQETPRTIRLTRLIKARSWPCPSVAHYCLADVPLPPAVAALMSACAEARAVVLHSYQILFPVQALENPMAPLQYFNPLIDTVFIDEIFPWAGPIAKKQGLINARQISISCNAWWAAWRREEPRKKMLATLQGFRKLEQLNLVFRIFTAQDYLLSPSKKTPSYYLDFPDADVRIQVSDIRRKFATMEALGGWKPPQVKLIHWGLGPKPKPDTHLYSANLFFASLEGH
ncbi:hypothetical protein B7494_g4826 [Chlorociboria aeruginascens]|nr:hypothetical protein B7494_g4826 [Chlorociboria aeruginascens]